MLKNLLLLTVPALVALFLVLELVLRFVVPAAEIPLMQVERGVLHFDPAGPREGVFTRGSLAQLRARWRVNDRGWNSEVEYRTAPERTLPLVAILGDSFINAFQVDFDENVAAVLRRLLADQAEVYAFGMDGSPMSQYLQVSRYVAFDFDPAVLVVNLSYNDFHESLQELVPVPSYLQFRSGPDGTLVEVPPAVFQLASAPGRLGRLRGSALYRYWKITLRSTGMSRLKSWLLRRPLPLYNANIPVEFVARHRERIEKVTARVLRDLRDENRKRRLIVSMDGPRFDIYAGSLAESNVTWLNDLVARECQRLGIPFVDLRERFARTHAATGARFESAIDSHWDEVGHAEVACAVYDELVALGLAYRTPEARARCLASATGPQP